MRTLLAAALFSGCGAPYPERPSDPDYGTQTTDTVPQFYGQVPRNLVMISIDTLRKDHVDRYADPDWLAEHGPVMPFLSGLFDTGFALDDAMQCSNWTLASVSCTLAGRYNVEAGMAPQLPNENAPEWPIGTPFLAGHLQELGVYSILASASSFLSGDWGNTQGYSQWFHPLDGSALGAWRGAFRRFQEVRELGLADRWFLHLHVTEPHAAYSPPERYLDEVRALPPAPWTLTDRDEHYSAAQDAVVMTSEERELLEAHLHARYRAEARWLDDQLFQIFQDLMTQGLLDDALLVIWSDHGEAFWEHGYHTHAYTLHGEENDALALFWSRNIVPRSFDGPTSTIDIAPTIMELFSGEVPEPMTGTPVSQVAADRTRFSWSVARLGSSQAVQKNGWKFVFPWVGPRRLYDRNLDPQERFDLYDPRTPHDRAFELWAELRPMVEQAMPLLPGFAVGWPDELEPDEQK